MKERIVTFVQTHWKYIIGLAVVLALLVFAYHEYQQWKQRIIDQANQAAAAQVQTVALPPQIIHTNTETVREVAVQAPSQAGSVLSFVERQGKVIAVIDGKEVEVPNLTGQPQVSLGENGELRMSQTTTAKIDVTDMANAQARLIANQELAAQKKIYDAQIKKEKDARNKERLLWIGGTVVGGYLLTK
jgi:hypothetical protein